jgi:hypothetical protein
MRICKFKYLILFKNYFKLRQLLFTSLESTVYLVVRLFNEITKIQLIRVLLNNKKNISNKAFQTNIVLCSNTNHNRHKSNNKNKLRMSLI